MGQENPCFVDDNVEEDAKNYEDYNDEQVIAISSSSTSAVSSSSFLPSFQAPESISVPIHSSSSSSQSSRDFFGQTFNQCSFESLVQPEKHFLCDKVEPDLLLPIQYI